MTTPRLQPVDIATGLISGTLAATFFTLAALAAVPDDEPTQTPRITAESSQK